MRGKLRANNKNWAKKVKGEFRTFVHVPSLIHII